MHDFYEGMYNVLPHMFAFLVGMASAYAYSYILGHRGKKIVILFDKNSDYINCRENYVTRDINRIRLLIFNNGESVIEKNDVNLSLNIGADDDIKILSTVTVLTSHNRLHKSQYDVFKNINLCISFDFLNTQDYIITDIFFKGCINDKSKAISLNENSYIKGYKIIVHAVEKRETSIFSKYMFYNSFITYFPFILMVTFYLYSHMKNIEISSESIVISIFILIYFLDLLYRHHKLNEMSKSYVDIFRNIPSSLIKNNLLALNK